jgi:hypothetical protein
MSEEGLDYNDTKYDKGHLSEAEELPPIPEEDLFEGGWELEAIEGLDLILDTGEELPRIFSTILDISGDGIMPLRIGAGLWPV